MLAFAAKPPGRTSLLPAPSSALSPQSSMSGLNPATASTAAAAVAAADQQTPPQQPTAAAAAGDASEWVSKVSNPGSAPTSPLAAAAHRINSIPENSALAATAAAPAGAHTAAAAAGAGDAAADDMDMFLVSQEDSEGFSAADTAHHMSFKAGEGLRSDSLEAKVEAYRQQLADVRAARIAAAQQPPPPAAAAAGVESGQQVPAGLAATAAATARTPSPFAAAAAAANSSSTTQQQVQGSQSPTASAASPSPSFDKTPKQHSSSSSNSKAILNTKTTSSSSSSSFSLKGLFSGKASRKAASSAAAGGSAAAARGLGGSAGDDDEWDNTPDEVWRIPLTSTADPAAYKLSPELSVAAGALVSQLQKNGRIEGRGRTNRSSCPVY